MLAVKAILHPTDFSAQADNAFELALALARDYGARVTLMHVRDLRAAAYGEFAAFPVDPGDDRKALQQKLADMKCAHELEVARFVLGEGDPATEIVDLAKSEGCDVIVMGTHGRRGLGRMLMGSVAEEVVRNAPCPVLTVKSPVGSGVETKAAKTAVCVS